MGFFNGQQSQPLLQAAQALYESSANGGRTGAGIASGLLGYKKGQKSQIDAQAAQEQARLAKEFRASQKAKIDAEVAALNNPQGKPTTIYQNYIEASKPGGFEGSFYDYQVALKNAGRNLTDISVGGAPLYKVPAGKMMVNPDEPGLGVKPIPGVDGVSGDSAKIMEIARGGTDAVEKLSTSYKGGDITQETLAAAMAPGVFNVFKSANVQQYETLTADLKDMLGRLRSGGAITSDELVTFSDLVPKFGDKDEVIEFKLSQLRDKFAGININVTPAALPSGDDSKVISWEDLP